VSDDIVMNLPVKRLAPMVVPVDPTEEDVAELLHPLCPPLGINDACGFVVVYVFYDQRIDWAWDDHIAYQARREAREAVQSPSGVTKRRQRPASQQSDPDPAISIGLSPDYPMFQVEQNDRPLLPEKPAPRVELMMRTLRASLDHQRVIDTRFSSARKPQTQI
jgi:hypothetical protein